MPSPYKVVCEADSLIYSFQTDSGQQYVAYFLRMDSYVTSFQNVYAFNLEQINNSTHPVDPRIAATVAELFGRFFENVENGIIYICDTTDGRELARDYLFDRWFRQYNDGRAEKYSAQQQTPDYLVKASLILLRNNPDKEQIISDFYTLVKNGMIPE